MAPLAPWQKFPPGFHSLGMGSARCGFQAFCWVGEEAGPTLVMTGGTHGDEYEGPTVLRVLAQEWRPNHLCGTVVAIPVLNEPAFFAGTRNHPEDGKNLAREFPGKADGSMTAQLAHLFEDQILSHADYYMDFHSGGCQYTLLPWVGYMTQEDAALDQEQEGMARCFSRYWRWSAPYIAGRTLSSAHALGVSAIYTESRGGGDVAPSDLKILETGIFRFLVNRQMIPGDRVEKENIASHRAGDAQEAHLQTHHPSPIDGIFVPSVALGDALQAGDPVGTIYPLEEVTEAVVTAQQEGRVVSLARKRSVTSGTALATLVPLPEFDFE